MHHSSFADSACALRPAGAQFVTAFGGVARGVFLFGIPLGLWLTPGPARSSSPLPARPESGQRRCATHLHPATGPRGRRRPAKFQRRARGSGCFKSSHRRALTIRSQVRNQAGGLTEISRGSERRAETPGSMANRRQHPGGVPEIQAERRPLAPRRGAPCSGRLTGGIADAQPPANFLYPSGILL